VQEKKLHTWLLLFKQAFLDVVLLHFFPIRKKAEQQQQQHIAINIK
jgi:hypothetical protein